MSTNARVGITGWRGFIGSRLAKKLAERIGNPVLFQGDMRSLKDVRSFVTKCDKIYHLAGKNRAAEGEILANNIVSAGNLAMVANEVETTPYIVFVSSRQVSWNPWSEYGFTRRIEEDIIRKCSDWSIFRLPNVYGPGGKPFYNSVVATFTHQIANRIDVVVDNPQATREFMYVDDVVDILLDPPMRHTLRVIVNVKGESMSIQDIYDYLTSRLGEHEKLQRCLDYCVREGVDK